jgi:hypothetical protein
LPESADGVPNPEPAILSVEVCFTCGWNIDGEGVYSLLMRV